MNFCLALFLSLPRDRVGDYFTTAHVCQKEIQFCDDRLIKYGVFNHLISSVEAGLVFNELSVHRVTKWLWSTWEAVCLGFLFNSTFLGPPKTMRALAPQMLNTYELVFFN